MEIQGFIGREAPFLGQPGKRVAVEEILVGHVSGEEHEAKGELWRQ